MHTCPEKILQTALVCNQVPPTLVKSECDNSEIQEPKLVKVSGFIDCCEFNDIFLWKGKSKTGENNEFWNLPTRSEKVVAYKKAIYYRVGDILTREIVEEEIQTCIKVGNMVHLPVLLLMRCRTEVKMKDVY